jgi:uncharacterized protein (UPF0332 family)
LLQQGRLRPYQARQQEIERLLQVAARDLTTADKLLAEDVDWAFNIVYNAVLQAARALVLHEGFRPRGAEQHRTIVLFCQEAFGPAHRRQVTLFDQMRRKRHRLVYEMVGLVSHQEAEQALVFARGFVEDIRTRITGQPRLEIGEA